MLAKITTDGQIKTFVLPLTIPNVYVTETWRSPRQYFPGIVKLFMDGSSWYVQSCNRNEDQSVNFKDGKI